MPPQSVSTDSIRRSTRTAWCLVILGVCAFLSSFYLPIPPNDIRVGHLWSVNQDGSPPVDFLEGGYWNDELGEPTATLQHTASWEPSPIGIGTPLWRVDWLYIEHIGRSQDKSDDLNDAIISRVHDVVHDRFTHDQVASAYRLTRATTRTLWWPALLWPPLVLLGMTLIFSGILGLRRVRRLSKRLRSWSSGPPYPCPMCGYDIGRVHSPCPECGTAIDVEALIGAAARGGEQ